ncbi:MAG: hypothetical protein NWE80_01570, partial [Candidatus Bathyarchaeota archaeon]|nr:hypothetical protein [Candidatus Bathyarchaeota archaeon]
MPDTENPNAQDCPEKCPRYENLHKCPKILGEGPDNASIMIVGRDPGQKEIKAGKPFVGQSGKLLNTMLLDVGLDRGEIFITNAVKCGNFREDKKPGKKEIKFCRSKIVEEIKIVKPWVIVACGAEALECVLQRDGISKLKNNVFWCDEFDAKVIPVFHPAYILRNPGLIQELKDGFSLLARECKSKQIVGSATQRTKVLVADNDEKINKVISKLERVDRFVCDLETSSLDPRQAEIGLAAVTWEAGLGIAIHWDKMNAEHRGRFQNLLTSNKVMKINHNLKYDMGVLVSNKVPIKGPFFDTMVAHSLIDENSFHGLDDCTLRYLDMGEYWKDLYDYKEEKEKELGREINFLEIPHEILDPYAAKDADATFRLAMIFFKELKEQGLLSYLKDYSMPTMLSLLKMELKGIKINREKMAGVIEKYKKLTEDLEQELFANPTIKEFEKFRRDTRARALVEKYESSKTLQSKWRDVVEYVNARIKEKEWRFNPESAPQMRLLFFDKRFLNLKPIKNTDSGNPST